MCSAPEACTTRSKAGSETLNQEVAEFPAAAQTLWRLTGRPEQVDKLLAIPMQRCSNRACDKEFPPEQLHYHGALYRLCDGCDQVWRNGEAQGRDTGNYLFARELGRLIRRVSHSQFTVLDENHQAID